MGLLAKIKGALFPRLTEIQKAEKIGIRLPQEASLMAYYGYSSRSYGTGSDGSKWPLGLSDSGQTPILDHRMLRQNARSVYHDTPTAKALVDRMADTVVDVGLKLEATPKFELLGITAQQAEEWGEEINERFDLWASSKKCFRDETLNLYQGQRLAGIFQQRDNDFFVRLFYSRKKDLMNPLQLGFIDPGQIRSDAYTDTYGLMQMDQDGIKRDKAGREISYSVYTKKNGNYGFIDIPAKGSKSKRLMMLHAFAPEYAGQKRGYSRLGHVIQEFENLQDFTLSEVKKAINQASITMYTKPGKDAPASNIFDEVLTQGGAGPTGLYQASDLGSELPEGRTENIQDLQTIRYVELPEARIRAPGSVAVFSLQEGEDLKAFEGTSPSESFEKFSNAFISYLSASVGMPIEVLLMKFNQNYSASRASLILFWRIAQIWRNELATDFLNPVYEMWLSGEIAAGRVSAPGWSDPILKAAWLSNSWIGAPRPNIDPMRSAKADQLYATMGAQTLDRIARDLNGSSGKANRAKLAREFEELPAAPWDQKQGGENPGVNEEEK